MKYKAEEILDILFDYYKVFSIKELSQIMGVSSVVISHWKARNSIKPLKQKCVELGIYDEIFNSLKIGTSYGNTAHSNDGMQLQNNGDIEVENKNSQICSDVSLTALFKDACSKAEQSENEIEKLKKILGKYLYA